MERNDLIKKISKLRGDSKVITYITSDRAPFNTKIAEDIIPILKDHISLDGNTRSEKVSVFLYTRGGDMIAPLKIVNLLRSYFTNFEVLLARYAHSAGTLISLGANNIVMTKLAELSPVDPTTTHLYNPTVASPNPALPAMSKPISVEDVNSYFLFAREKAKVRPEDIDKVYSYLINNAHKENSIHPIALGNVYRGYRMARKLAERMLKFHSNGFFAERKIKKIVNALTGEIPTHDYPIYRDEALDLGLKVEYPEPELETAMFDLLDSYTKAMEIGRPFNPAELLGATNEKSFDSKGAFIESEKACDAFTFRGTIKRDSSDPTKIGINITSSKWERS